MNTGGLSSSADEDHHHDLALAAADLNLISVQDRKEQALQVLKSDLQAKLNEVVKSLDEDSWMFDGPRSRVHLISRPGGLRGRHTGISTSSNSLAARK